MLRKTFERVARKSLKSCLPMFDRDFKLDLAHLLLRDCGFGSGAPVSESNEEAVVELIDAKAPVLFDIGAHIGEYTLMFKRHFRQGRVYCFEPSQLNFDRLREATRDLDGVDCLNCALGKHEGEATLFREEGISSLASLTKRRLGHFELSLDIEETIKVTTLDQFVRDNGIEKIDLLKIDVEGHELDVLAGAKETIGAGRIGIVQFEFGGCNLDTRTNFQDFFYFFAVQHDFRLFIVTRYGLEPIGSYREIYEQYQTTNFVAVRS